MEYFSRLLTLHHIRHEQDGSMFTFEDGRTLLVKTTETGGDHQLCPLSVARGAKIVVFARLGKWPDKQDMAVKHTIEFRGFLSRNFLTGKCQIVKYRKLAEAYKVKVARLLPMSELFDWLRDCYGEDETQAA